MEILFPHEKFLHGNFLPLNPLLIPTLAELKESHGWPRSQPYTQQYRASNSCPHDKGFLNGSTFWSVFSRTKKSNILLWGIIGYPRNSLELTAASAVSYLLVSLKLFEKFRILNILTFLFLPKEWTTAGQTRANLNVRVSCRCLAEGTFNSLKVLVSFLKWKVLGGKNHSSFHTLFSYLPLPETHNIWLNFFFYSHNVQKR